MRLIDLFPHWANAPVDQIIDEIGLESLGNLLTPTAEYYVTALPFWKIFPRYDVENVSSDDDDAYVACKLASHGSVDKHASARYFKMDRNTGAERPAFYCYKCQKMLTSFWYVYAMERDFAGKSLKDVLKLIYQVWNVPPPLDIWFNFDSDKFYAEGGGGDSAQDVTPFFEEALAVAELKGTDPRLFLARLKQVLTKTLA